MSTIKEFIENNQGAIFNTGSDIMGLLNEITIPKDRTNSPLTDTLNLAGNTIANAAGSIHPGLKFGLKMIPVYMNIKERLGLLPKLTSGETVFDSIMDSDYMKLSPLSMINRIGAKTTSSIKRDSNLDFIASSYSGVSDLVNDASNKSNKRFGWFSTWGKNSKYDQYENTINKAIELLDKAVELAKDLKKNNTLLLSNYENIIDQYNTKVYGHTRKLKIKNGMKLNSESIKRIKSRNKNNWIPTLIINNNYASRNIEQLLNYASKRNPRFWLRMFESPIKYLNQEGNLILHKLSYTEDENGNFYIFPTVQEDDNGNLKDYSDMAFIRALKKGDYLLLNSKEEAETFSNEYKQINPEIFNILKLFKDGGLFDPVELQKGGIVKESEVTEIEETTQKNVIPEGALHKNKHHMEHAEGLTKKGIPVIDNNGEQQAEVEKEELVLILEVTQKLEELKQRYEESNDDKYAIEAGALIIDQILNNLDDRTNLLNKLEDETK